MKTITLTCCALLFCVVTTFSQKIQYRSSFEDAQQIALAQNKPLAVLITLQPPSNATNFLRVLSHPEVVEKFNSSFINFKVQREDPGGKKLISEYKITRFPSLLFLDSKGGLLSKNIIITPIPAGLLSIAGEVINASMEVSLVDMDATYQAGTYDNGFLKEYIIRRKKAGISNNAELIEKYVDNLTIADLEHYDQVLFILQAGPVSNGRAYKLAYTNRTIIDSIFKNESYEVRSAINNAIISNTMASAIATRNVQQAQAAAQFTRTSWGKNYLEAQKNYSLKMLQYYTAVKDTKNYLQLATNFYDITYMKISVDSIRKKETEDIEKAKLNARAKAVTTNDEVKPTRNYSITYTPNRSAIALNNAAWSVYQTGTRDGTYRTKAMLWSKRAIELNPVAGFYDTLAHLLYRLGFYAEAESTQRKAIELGRVEKRSVKELEAALTEIRQRSIE